MIDGARYLVDLHPVWKDIPPICHHLQQVIVKVGPVALSIITQLALYRLFPNLCVYGFVFGFIFSEDVIRKAEKVNVVFNSCKTLLQKIGLAALGVLAVYGMPACLIVATIYHSAYWGAYLYRTSADRLRRYQARGI